MQRIYRMATEKSQISVYEYLESIGVPRVNALQVQSRASEWFEFENAKAAATRTRLSASSRWRLWLIF